MFPLRRDVEGGNGGISGPVASEERSALLFQRNDTQESVGPVEDPVPVSGDPTQRLLTALGRFHRYVAKGQAGAPQEFWTDDCMNQLVVALEVALPQKWPHIVDAITGTARVMQSYENAGCAHMCASFLNESYEILCLMVGDLIVNKVRQSVLDKWRERYEQAVAELTAAGLTLVEDDVHSDEAPEQEQTPAVSAPVAKQGEVLPFALPEDRASGASSRSDEPSMDDFLPPADKKRSGSSLSEAEERAPEPEASLEDESAVETDEEEAAEADEDAEVAEVPSAPTLAGRVTDPEVVKTLDALCDELSQLEHAEPEDYRAGFEAISSKVSWLHQYANGKGVDVAAAVSARMQDLCRLVHESKKSPEDSFFDTAFAFCEVFVTAMREPDSALITSWNADADAQLAALQPRKSATAAALGSDSGPPVAAAPQENSPESLLETAQRAIAEGDMAGAKTLALQAVAHLAATEMAKAEKRVQDAELRFQENAEAIERARASSKKCEQDVLVAEGRVAEGQTELSDAHAHANTIIEKCQGIERRVADIDEQIRVLQAARSAEEQRLGDAHSELDRAHDVEREMEQQLESVMEAERSARAALENSRQSVKDHLRRRQDLEAALSRARETLSHHRNSLADIERTIGIVRPEVEKPEPESEGLLF